MPYLIDSDIVIDHFANVPDVTQLLEALASKGIAISIITYMETYQGVLRSPDREMADTKFQAFLETVPILPFSVNVARRCAQLRETLKSKGKRVSGRALDLMTASIALEHNLMLVTRNFEDYKDIPKLALYRLK